MGNRVFEALGLWLCLILLASCGSRSNTTTVASSTTATTPSVANMWVVSWGASPENAATSSENPGGAEQTFRSFFYPTVSGTEERVRFSNYFGTAPITIGAARLAIAATPPAIDPTHDVALTFSGSPSVTIAPGAEVASDPVSLTMRSVYRKGGRLTQRSVVATNGAARIPPL